MNKRVLITDVDNTLFDWIDFWGQAFSAMMRRFTQLEGVDKEKIYREIRKVHQNHGTSEYAFMLEELPYVRGLDPIRRYRLIQEANAEFARARDSALILYPTVLDALKKLKGEGVYIVAYTESYSRYTGYRFKKFGLDGIIDRLYAPEDHHASNGDYAHLSHSLIEEAILNYTEVRNTPKGETKPNPDILRSICAEVGEAVDACVYVGDSLMKDIAMAQDVGMTAAFAAYGKADHRDEYETLRAVTHWTNEDVEREKAINARDDVTPEIVLKRRFSEVLPHVITR